MTQRLHSDEPICITFLIDCQYEVYYVRTNFIIPKHFNLEKNIVGSYHNFNEINFSA